MISDTKSLKQDCLKLEIKVTNQWSYLSDPAGIICLIHRFPNPVSCIVVHSGLVCNDVLIPTNMSTLQFTLHKLHTDLPRFPWKVSQVVQEAPIHRGGADGRDRGGERRAPLATGWAKLSGCPNWETEFSGGHCRWGWFTSLVVIQSTGS